MELLTSTAYINGQFVPFKDATLSIASAPVLYGLSVYTVMRANYNPTAKKLFIFRLEDHYERLTESAKIIDFNGFEAAWPYHKFKTTMIELLTRNAAAQDTLIRITLYIDELVSGTRMHGLKVGLSAFTYPSVSPHDPSGIHVCVSSWQRTPDNAVPARAKVNGSYVNSALMKNEALLNGYDDAIALDEHGHVSESTVANIFVVRRGVLITPHTATDILEGITRSSILALADSLGVQHQQRSLDRSELYVADEVFLSGSSVQVIPVLSVDKRQIGDGKAGQVSRRLAKAYQDAQRGDDAEHAVWLTEVS